MSCLNYEASKNPTMQDVDRVMMNLRMENKTPVMLLMSANLIINLMQEVDSLYCLTRTFPLYTKEQLLSLRDFNLVYKGLKIYRIVEDNIIVAQ